MWLLDCYKESKLQVDYGKRLTSPVKFAVISNIKLKVILEPISMSVYFKTEYLWIWGVLRVRKRVRVRERVGFCFYMKASLSSQVFSMREFDCKSSYNRQQCHAVTGIALWVPLFCSRPVLCLLPSCWSHLNT